MGEICRSFGTDEDVLEQTMKPHESQAMKNWRIVDADGCCSMHKTWLELT